MDKQQCTAEYVIIHDFTAKDVILYNLDKEFKALVSMIDVNSTICIYGFGRLSAIIQMAKKFNIITDEEFKRLSTLYQDAYNAVCKHISKCKH